MDFFFYIYIYMYVVGYLCYVFIITSWREYSHICFTCM